MMKQLFFKKAQNLTELALMVATLGLVLLAMQTYVQRGIQSRVKDLTDHIVGTEQSAYATDVSGLSDIDSTTTTYMGFDPNSKTVRSTLVGGARQTTKTEDIKVESTSTSQYIP